MKQQQQQKSQEEQLREYLIEEAREGYRLITLSDQKYRKQQDIKTCYLISRNWFNQWCEYVGYNEAAADLEPQSEKFASVKPNKQINEEFVQQQSDKSLISNLQLFKFNAKRVAESSYLNVILKNDQNINTFKVVDEDTWTFFALRYPGGFEIQRPVSFYQNRIIQNIQLLQPEIVVYNEELVEQVSRLSDMQLKNGINSLNSQKCQLPSFFTLSQLKNLFKKEFGVDNVRVWRLDASVKREDIQFQTGKSIKQKQNQVRAVELVEAKIGNLVLQEFVKNHYSLIVELPIRGKFELRQSNQNSISNGKFIGICEYCIKLIELNVRCVCREVAYCSSNCKYKDQDFHSHTCEVAADSESDEEMDFLPLEISGKAGLKNIGNTCYLAAALQNIYITKEFSQKFTMNEVTKIPNQRCKLLQKFSKLLKEMSMLNEESIEPWSFKTQLGRINQMFSGNYQHDAAEFITCLIDALNEECQKKDTSNGKKNIDFSKPDQFWEHAVKSGYNQAVLESFMGLFESSIQCPDCNHTSVNYEPFSILSLPIKQKPVVKQIMVNFIKANIAEQTYQATTSYTTGQTTILDLIKYICDKVQIPYKTNVVVCTYNGESIQSYYIKPDSLTKTVEDLEVELDGKNKSLLFFEVAFDTATYDPLNHKLIKIDFERIGKQSMGFIQVDKKVNFSAPRIMIVDRNQNISSIYLQLFEQLKEIYPEAYQIVQESYQEYKELKSEAELGEEKPNSKTTSAADLEEQRKQEDIKWNGASDSPVKANKEVVGKQETQQTQSNQQNKNKSSQNISPPKQQQQQQQVVNAQPLVNQIEDDGWGNYEIPVVPPKKTPAAQQSQTKQTGKQNTQQPIKQTQPQQQQTIQSQNKKETPNTQQTNTSSSLSSQSTTASTTQAANSASQNVQSESSNDGGWGWDSEIVIAPKKVTPAQPKTTTQTQQQSAQQTTAKPVVEEDEFTQVTSNKKGKNKQQNSESQQDNYYNNNNNKKNDSQNNNNNNQQKGSNNANKPTQQKNVETTKSSNTQKTSNSNGVQQKNAPKQQQTSLVNPFAAGWGDEDVSSTTQQPSASAAQQNISSQNNLSQDKQLPVSSEPKSNLPASTQQETQASQTSQPTGTQQNTKKTKIIKEDFSELLTKLPFSVNIKSKKRRIGGAFKCFFCSKQNCQNCSLQYENQRTLSQLLATYRDLFELELFWQKEQPSKVLEKTIIDQNSANSQAKKQNLPTLQYCLEEFSQREQLSSENQWYCTKCQKSQQAFKKLSIQYAPNNLIIQIKRFKTNLQDGSKEKNYQQVVFPETGFSLTNSDKAIASPSIQKTINNNDIQYELYGVIVHEGTTENGHYIAHCKYEKIWYSFDDDNINIIDVEKVLNNKNAYILFYRLK